MDSTTKNCSGRLKSFLESIELVLMFVRAQTKRVPDIPYDITKMPVSGGVSGEVRVELLDGLIPARDGKHARFFLRAWDRSSQVIVAVAIEKTATMKSVKTAVRKVLNEHFLPITETITVAEGSAQANFQGATVVESGTDMVVQAVLPPEPAVLAPVAVEDPSNGATAVIVAPRVIKHRSRVVKVEPPPVIIINQAFVLKCLQELAVGAKKARGDKYWPLAITQEYLCQVLIRMWGGDKSISSGIARGNLTEELIKKWLILKVEGKRRVSYRLHFPPLAERLCKLSYEN